jgi:hypothetical protein
VSLLDLFEKPKRPAIKGARRIYHNRIEGKAEAMRKWREKNPDYDKLYYHANKDKINAKRVGKKNKYYHPERARAYWQEYYAKNKEKILEQQRIYRVRKREQRLSASITATSTTS